jgi:hypothetical protein
MPIITFPGGQEVCVEFDDTAHSYVVAHKLADGQFSDFRPTHGVTTPLDVVPKPFLKPWAAKEAVLALLDYIDTHNDLIPSIPQFLKDVEDYESKARTPEDKPVMSYYKFTRLYPWYAKVKKACDVKSAEGKEIGTWAHKAIESFYSSDRKTVPILTPQSVPIWESFTQFDNYHKPKPEALEFFVYSLLFGYSGQGDFKGWMNGKYCIGDWKTSNRTDWSPEGITIEYFFQVGGLAQAEYERTGKWVDDLFIANFDKKGEEPKVIWASDIGMSPQDAARAYISCFNNHHMYQAWDYRFSKR